MRRVLHCAAAAFGLAPRGRRAVPQSPPPWPTRRGLPRRPAFLLDLRHARAHRGFRRRPRQKACRQAGGETICVVVREENEPSLQRHETASGGGAAPAPHARASASRTPAPTASARYGPAGLPRCIDSKERLTASTSTMCVLRRRRHKLFAQRRRRPGIPGLRTAQRANRVGLLSEPIGSLERPRPRWQTWTQSPCSTRAAMGLHCRRWHDRNLVAYPRTAAAPPAHSLWSSLPRVTMRATLPAGGSRSGRHTPSGGRVRLLLPTATLQGTKFFGCSIGGACIPTGTSGARCRVTEPRRYLGLYHGARGVRCYDKDGNGTHRGQADNIATMFAGIRGQQPVSCASWLPAAKTATLSAAPPCPHPI